MQSLLECLIFTKMSAIGPLRLQCNREHLVNIQKPRIKLFWWKLTNRDHSTYQEACEHPSNPETLCSRFILQMHCCRQFRLKNGRFDGYDNCGKEKEHWPGERPPAFPNFCIAKRNSTILHGVTKVKVQKLFIRSLLSYENNCWTWNTEKDDCKHKLQ